MKAISVITPTTDDTTIVVVLSTKTSAAAGAASLLLPLETQANVHQLKKLTENDRNV